MFSRCEPSCAACGRRAGTYGWNAGRGTDWQIWAQASRAGSEEHVDCDISNTQGLSLRERVCLQRWSFLPAQCGLIHLGRYLTAVLLYGSMRVSWQCAWPHSLSWLRSIWTPGVPGTSSNFQQHINHAPCRAETQPCDASALQYEAKISTERGANSPGKGGRGCIANPDKRAEKTKENEGNEGRSETWAGEKVWDLWNTLSIFMVNVA